MAREKKEKGDNKVKVGYKKINLKDRWYRWNEKEEKLEEERRGREYEWEYDKKGGKEMEDGEKGLKICFWNIAGRGGFI